MLTDSINIAPQFLSLIIHKCIPTAQELEVSAKFDSCLIQLFGQTEVQMVIIIPIIEVLTYFSKPMYLFSFEITTSSLLLAPLQAVVETKDLVVK